MALALLRRSAPRTAICTVLFAVVSAALASPARADELHLPRIGHQYATVGVAAEPGFLFDTTVPSEPRWKRHAITSAGMARLGFHQIVSKYAIMSVEGSIGAQWLDEHTASRSGRADSEVALAWEVGLLGRWLPAGEDAGWSVGGGPHLFYAHLADRPLQSLGLTLRAGRYFWLTTEQFLLLEVGYRAPFIQGLNRSQTTRSRDGDAPEDWTLHRFGVSIQLSL